MSTNLFNELTTLSTDTSFENKYLYHYTTWEVLSKSILPEFKFRFHSYKNVRDPFEYKRNSFIFSKNTKPEFINLDKSITQLINKQIKIACFSLNYKGIKNNDLVMSRGFSKSRMWSRWANKHTGICLVFKKKPLKNDIIAEVDEESFFAKKIKYSKDIYLKLLEFNIPKVFENKLDCFEEDDIYDYYKKYFFKKDNDYKDADEYRIIFKDNKNDFTDIALGKSLKAIIIGDNFDKSQISALKDLIKGKNIDIFEYIFRDYLYSLEQII